MTHRRHKYFMRIDPNTVMVLQQVMQQRELVNYKVTNTNDTDFTLRAIYIAKHLELRYTYQVFDVGSFDWFMEILRYNEAGHSMARSPYDEIYICL